MAQPPPRQGRYPFDPGEAAKDPFGVGNVTPLELDKAFADAIQSRLDDHPEEWATLSKAQLIKGVLQYSDGETRQPQDVRKRYMLNLQRAHVTTERVMFVQAAQADPMKPRDAALGTDLGDEAEGHPIHYQVISVDGQCKDIMIINDGTMPVLYAAGSLVIYAHLITRGTTPPGQGQYPFDPGEAAKDPFGVGTVTPPEFDKAIADAIQSRLDDHPEEWTTLPKAQLIKGVLQYSNVETRQVQDVCKRCMLNL